VFSVAKLSDLVANSEKMQAVVRVAEKVAPTDATVLITGESGTGKNALAEFIHARSKRADRELVKIDCAALPKELLEAELFGHERGAFTGATEARPGRLEAAHKSTLLLDEIALLPIDAQAKLLRVLEQREFERLGGRKIFKIDVRVIATTNVDLENAIRQKRFREDLFFRLNVVRVEVPPLRQRRDDVTTLAQEFLQVYAAKHAREKMELSADALKLLEKYEFPGNVRELSNLIERAVLIANGKITANQFPSSLQTASQNGKNWLTLAEVEEKHVLETLTLTKNNKSKAAKLLGISRKNLYEKLARYTLTEDIK
jgi:two-component system, NtrC family, response regulator HydG